MSFQIVIATLLLLSTAYAVSFNPALAVSYFNFAAMSYCPFEYLRNWNGPYCDSSFKTVLVNDSVSGSPLQAYVSTNARDQVVITFRGTQPLSLEDWLTDLDIAHVDAPDLCKDCTVHAGFNYAYSILSPAVIDAVEACLEAAPNSTVTIIGHSLGGAIASLFAVRLATGCQGHCKAPSSPIQVFSYGAPRLGNEHFAQFYNSILPNSWRIQHNKDVVPHLPPTEVGYYHCGTLVWCPDNNVQNCEVRAGAENDGGILHVSVIDHTIYMGLELLPFLPIGGAKSCGTK